MPSGLKVVLAAFAGLVGIAGLLGGSFLLLAPKLLRRSRDSLRSLVIGGPFGAAARG
jgi:hypothetical protein